MQTPTSCCMQCSSVFLKKQGKHILDQMSRPLWSRALTTGSAPDLTSINFRKARVAEVLTCRELLFAPAFNYDSTTLLVAIKGCQNFGHGTSTASMTCKSSARQKKQILDTVVSKQAGHIKIPSGKAVLWHHRMPADSAFFCGYRINDAFRELLESGPKPSVAAVRGLALGGGLETAMACNARVASPGHHLPIPRLYSSFAVTEKLANVGHTASCIAGAGLCTGNFGHHANRLS